MVLLMESLTPRGAKTARLSPLGVLNTLWTLSPVSNAAGRLNGMSGDQDAGTAGVVGPFTLGFSNTGSGRPSVDDPREREKKPLGARLLELASPPKWPLAREPPSEGSSRRSGRAGTAVSGHRGGACSRRWRDVARFLTFLPLLALDAALALTVGAVSARRFVPHAAKRALSWLLRVWQLLAAELWSLVRPETGEPCDAAARVKTRSGAGGHQLWTT